MVKAKDAIGYPPIPETIVWPKRALRWVRRHLLASPWDAFLTVAAFYLLYLIVPMVLKWALWDASWTGTSRADCTGDGACWVFVKERFGQFIYGFYPETQRWRVNLTALFFAAGLTITAMRRLPRLARRLVALAMVTIFPTMAYYLLRGGAFGLQEVETAKWGGLMVTLIISVVGIAGSLPLGIILVLGRRSSMPVLRKLSVAFIELWRGVPLITVLFMASVMLPLFLPGGMSFDKLLRALIGVTLFSAAYMAEVVRGGLQAIPRGQYEAAAALGLGYWRTMGLIILPQALRLVIPGIVNTFIGLFKDTTLVLIIGIFDLLGIVQAATTDPEWLGQTAEGYVFAGLMFWVFCFAMSRYSVRLERRLARSSQGT